MLRSQMNSTEEVSARVHVPFSIGKTVCSMSAGTANMEISGLKCINDGTTFLSKPQRKPDMLSPGRNACYEGNSSRTGIGRASTVADNGKERIAPSTNIAIESNNSLTSRKTYNMPSKDDQLASSEHEHLPEDGPSQSAGGGSGSDCGKIVRSYLTEPNGNLEPMEGLSSVTVDFEVENGYGSDPKACSLTPDVLQDKINRTGSLALELDGIPLWGFISIRGRRPEMEDAVAAVPRFLQIPTRMLMVDNDMNGMNRNATNLTAHFFGVYDGHGGSQVSNYCSQRLHLALADQIEHVRSCLCNEAIKDCWQEQWKKAFSNCFLKVDSEVGGSGRGTTESNSSDPESHSEPIAPETVGSTAVVAIVCSTHIIVANCGDSRAVLYRGKMAMPLSVDHKVTSGPFSFNLYEVPLDILKDICLLNTSIFLTAR
ncbi:hypothetical protein K2173_004508 [Erythroxylum novogranatense]|uniref:protein-serine/threonine phosphatase n=1 Tax=Erythroxylum novogranatense TaxID=1862640 RepID=A0AAV8TKM6_9ROSI|nr:hypothetical protein K2173_004508 [Erythroxylum novogranatense]